MKEVPNMKKEVRLTYHYYQNSDAVLLDDGRAMRHPYEGDPPLACLLYIPLTHRVKG